MTWIKLDDQAVDHPKVAGLSDRAFRTWIRGMSYASRFLTDGELPLSFLYTVKAAARDELVAAGLWEHWVDEPDHGIRIHDYLNHQRDKATVTHQRDRNKERQKRHRNTVTNAEHNAVTNAGSNGHVTRLESETELETEKKEQIQTPALARLDGRFETWWSAYPKKKAKTEARKAWLKIKPSDELLSSMLNALSWQRNQPGWLKDGGQFIPNPATYLNGGCYLDEPFHTPNLSEKSIRLLQTVTGGRHD